MNVIKAGYINTKQIKNNEENSTPSSRSSSSRSAQPSPQKQENNWIYDKSFISSFSKLQAKMNKIKQ